MPAALTALIADYCATHPPAEYLGEPGDVLLWSSHTIHSGSSNLSDRPRIGAFTVRTPPAPRDPQTLSSSPALGPLLLAQRWHHRRRLQMRTVVTDDTWEHWRLPSSSVARL